MTVWLAAKERHAEGPSALVTVLAFSGLQELAARVAAEIRELIGQDDEVWAVTHSMGGIILRHIQALPDQGQTFEILLKGSLFHEFTTIALVSAASRSVVDGMQSCSHEQARRLPCDLAAGGVP